MQTISIKFHVPNIGELDVEELDDLLRALVDNGQLIEFFHYPRRDSNLIEYHAISMDETSLNNQYFNRSITRRIADLNSRSTTVEFETLDSQQDNYAVDINKVANFALYYGGGSPVRSLDTFYEVPLYLFPKTSEDGDNYFNIITWARNYEAIYGLWFRSQIEEEYFFNQLANFRSPLSEQGISICNQLRELTKKPFYYFLRRPLDSDYEEFASACPGCKHPWKSTGKLVEDIEFICNNCLLIS